MKCSNMVLRVYEAPEPITARGPSTMGIKMYKLLCIYGWRRIGVMECVGLIVCHFCKAFSI